jgi:hypothetical protein
MSSRSVSSRRRRLAGGIVRARRGRVRVCVCVCACVRGRRERLRPPSKHLGHREWSGPTSSASLTPSLRPPPPLVRALARPTMRALRPFPRASGRVVRPPRPAPIPPAAVARPPPLHRRPAPPPAASAGGQGPSPSSPPPLAAGATTVGEDAAAFDLAAQSVGRWAFFAAELTVVMVALWVVRSKRKGGGGRERQGGGERGATR